MAEDQDRRHHHQHEQELLSISSVGSIMKQILPSTSKISKEAKETMQECATKFIMFVTGEANDICQKDNRQTVTGDDICLALRSLGFDNYADGMIRFLQKRREIENQEIEARTFFYGDTEDHQRAGNEMAVMVEALTNVIDGRTAVPTIAFTSKSNNPDYATSSSSLSFLSVVSGG